MHDFPITYNDLYITYVIVYLIYISNKSKLENEVRYRKTVKAIIYHFQEILEMKKT